MQSESDGEEDKILTSGFPVRGRARAAVPVGQVQNVSLTEGDHAGSVDCHFDPVKHRSSYEVQISTTDSVNGPYTQAATPTASKVVLKGLVSGHRIWVRVRAIGAAGPGPWSDPATKIVP